MPVVIKELHVKVNVEENSTRAATTSRSSDNKELVDVCVEKVLEVLKQKKRR